MGFNLQIEAGGKPERNNITIYSVPDTILVAGRVVSRIGPRA